MAAAVLIAWLLVELARLALGDLRFPRLHEGSLQGSPSGPSPVHSGTASHLPGSTDGRSAGASDDRRATPGPPGPAAGDPAGPGSTGDEGVLYDEADVEQAIRDRLYGGRGRGRRT